MHKCLLYLMGRLRKSVEALESLFLIPRQKLHGCHLAYNANIQNEYKIWLKLFPAALQININQSSSAQLSPFLPRKLKRIKGIEVIILVSPRTPTPLHPYKTVHNLSLEKINKFFSALLRNLTNARLFNTNNCKFKFYF